MTSPQSRWTTGLVFLGLALLSSCGPEDPVATISVVGSLADPSEMAGILVSVGPREFAAEDFDENGQLRLIFPDSGSLELGVRLELDGEIVAEGVRDFRMGPDRLWYIGISRSVDRPSPCVVCPFPEGYSISESAQADPDEHLWVSVVSYPRDNRGVVY